MIKVDIRYKIPSFGKYTKAVYVCPHCNFNMLDILYQHICGFNESSIGLLKVVECSRCFEKFSSHCGEHDYELFLTIVKEGKNKFFK